MAQSAQIDKLTPRHENIIAFLIANPTMKKADVARTFGVTPAWLSTIVNSDVFKAKMAERQDEYFGAVTTPIREKLENLASLALDELEEKVQVTNDLGGVREVAKLALQSLGYGNAGGVRSPAGPALVQQNNYYTVSREALSEAREKVLTRNEGSAHGATIEGPQGQKHLAAPAELQTRDGLAMGPALLDASPVAQASKDSGPETAG